MDETSRLIEAGAHPQPAGTVDPLRAMRTKDIVTELTRKGRLLARKEIELARVEVKADIQREIRMVSGLGVAALCALFTVQLLLVAVVLAVGAAAGLWGWTRRVRVPLDSSRRSLKENVRWAKEQLA